MTALVGSHAGHDVKIQAGVKIPMRDGCVLVADVYLPAVAGSQQQPVPAILEATPYNRKRVDLKNMAMFFARRGYAVVLVDSRGRNESGGEFRFFFAEPHEGHDMFDIVEYIAAQPWSDGKVGTTGLSFAGNNQQTAAILKPPHLTTSIVMDAGYNYWWRTFRHAGALTEGILMPYALWMALGGKEAAKDARVRQVLRAALDNIDAWLTRLPLKPGDSPLAAAPSYERWYFEMMNTTDFEGVWRNPMVWIEGYMDDWADIPVLLLTSWYGHHAWANLEKWRRLKAANRKQPVHLMSGIWLHAFDYTGQSFAGDADFGPDASFNQDDLRLRWFDRFLKGMDTGVDKDAPMRLFVGGGGSGRKLLSGRLDHGGRWLDAGTWPVENSRSTTFYLHADGVLGEDVPDGEVAPTTYIFDPRNPVPTIGGSLQNPMGDSRRAFIKGGAFDQRGRLDLTTCTDTLPLATRPDVRVFRTAPLEQPLDLVGEVVVRLWVATTGGDTDFTAKLIDEYQPSDDYPEGFAMNLCDSIVRLRYRGGGPKSEAVEPSKVYEIEIGPMVIANHFARGHRLRLDISSSNWPLYDVNPNTGGPLQQSGGGIAVVNTLYHDGSRASRLTISTLK